MKLPAMEAGGAGMKVSNRFPSDPRGYDAKITFACLIFLGLKTAFQTPDYPFPSMTCPAFDCLSNARQSAVGLHLKQVLDRGMQ